MTPITLDAFESCSIPHAQWTHRAHLTVAFLMLRRHGLHAAGLDAATSAMCRGIQRYNASQGIQQTPTGGYHETLTIAWMRIIHAMMENFGPAGGDPASPATAGAFLDYHTQLHSTALLRLYYSRDRIMSLQARTGWVEPDLATLPRKP